MNLFVAKLSAATTSDDLNELFAEYGEVVSAKVIMDRETGTSKRFGFVEMKDEAAAMKAIKDLNECLFDNSPIVVKKARPKGENRNNHSYGNNRDRSFRRY
ncbi:RNA recognition motif domain-containing protein [Thermophagus xiamenensis]|uniref:RNA recognition motif. (A.k.a. RRM, RBD, or RNP domain) n=1 Tax=Thermophagus xiamenensis TaxID=385682 RepID=A0A1I2A152_9BACT|nr:RNA-binding protein [Thermophagus xiamenensis]SFE37631.1 RNA recognition motif. (a.k.a. RRM, RBD, or RNP domain) [Thermophagus xiamenensis]